MDRAGAGSVPPTASVGEGASPGPVLPSQGEAEPAWVSVDAICDAARRMGWWLGQVHTSRTQRVHGLAPNPLDRVSLTDPEVRAATEEPDIAAALGAARASWRPLARVRPPAGTANDGLGDPAWDVVAALTTLEETTPDWASAATEAFLAAYAEVGGEPNPAAPHWRCVFAITAAVEAADRGDLSRRDELLRRARREAANLIAQQGR